MSFNESLFFKENKKYLLSNSMAVFDLVCTHFSDRIFQRFFDFLRFVKVSRGRCHAGFYANVKERRSFRSAHLEPRILETFAIFVKNFIHSKSTNYKRKLLEELLKTRFLRYKTEVQNATKICKKWVKNSRVQFICAKLGRFAWRFFFDLF